MHGYVEKMLEAIGGASSSAGKEFSEQVLLRSFWGLPETPAPTVDAADAADGAASSPIDDATAAVAPAFVWSQSLPEDTKFDDSLVKNAPATLTKLVWMRALSELIIITDSSAGADGSATTTDGADSRFAKLQLPEKITKELGVGQLAGSSKGGTLPARWWKSEQDRALLEHTAACGLALADTTWAQLAVTPVFAPPTPATPAPAAPAGPPPSASLAPAEAGASSDDAAAATAPAPTAVPMSVPGAIALKIAANRRDALLRRLQIVQYGKPGPSAELKRSRFFGSSAAAAAPPPPKPTVPHGDAADEGERGAKCQKKEVGRVESWESSGTAPVEPDDMAADGPTEPLSAVPKAMRDRIVTSGGASVHSPMAAGGGAQTAVETPVTQLHADGKQKAAVPPSEEPAPKRAKSDAVTDVAAPTAPEKKGAFTSAGLKSDPKQAGLMGFFKKSPAATAAK